MGKTRIVNASAGESWPEGKFREEEINVQSRIVLIDEETGKRIIAPEYGERSGLREGAKYRCEKEWLLVAGWNTTLATFKSRERACEALKELTREMARGARAIYINSEE